MWGGLYLSQLPGSSLFSPRPFAQSKPVGASQKKKKNHPVFPYPGHAGCSADGDWRVPCRAVTPAVRGLSHQARLSR